MRVIDFMPPRGTKPDIVRIVEGLDGRVEMRTELVMRFDYGSIVPWVRRLDGHTLLAIGGPDALVLRTPIELQPQAMTHVADFTVRRGDRVPFVLTWFPSAEKAPERGRPRAGAAGDGVVLARLAPRLQVRGRLSRGCAHLAARAQGAHVRPDGRDRRGADDVAARADRRRAQLGLPVLLAARRDVHALRADERGLPGRGARVARLAAPRRRGRSGEHADPLRRRRRAPRPGARARLAARLRRLAAGAHRERGARAVPARRVRRDDGRAARSAPARARSRRPRLVAAATTSSNSSKGPGTSRTKASGRCAGRGATSRTRRCSRGSRSTAPSKRSSAGTSQGPSTAGAACGRRSTRRSAARGSTSS